MPPEMRHDGGEQRQQESEANQPYIIEIDDVRDGQELLSRLPSKFEGNAEITVTGKVRGKEENQTISVRTDVEDLILDEGEGDFWAIRARFPDGTERLLDNGNYTREDGEVYAEYGVPANEWNWKERGMENIGRLTGADVYNLVRFDEISHATVRIEKPTKSTK